MNHGSHGFVFGHHCTNPASKPAVSTRGGGGIYNKRTFAIGGGALGAIVAMNIEKSIRFDFKFTNVLIYTAAATAVVWILDIIISRRLLEGLEVQ